MRFKNFKDVRNLLIIFIVIILCGYLLVVVINYVNFAFAKKVTKTGEIYMKTGSTISTQAQELVKENFLADTAEYILFAKKMNIKVKPGKYTLKDGMTLKELLYYMGSGKQDEIKVIFNYIKDKETLASDISKQLEIDSIGVLNMLNNDSLLNKYNLNTDNVIYSFIPDTYFMYWSATEEDIIKRMSSEANKFWAANNREQKLNNTGLSKYEMYILASIIEKESNHAYDMRIIAGIYLNRLKRGILLQACPTVLYAIGDPSIKRLYNKHLEIDSPYNTYKYSGLPPTPIGAVSRNSINAVLDYIHTDYLYFCASPELDGRHAFAKTLREHNRNAQRYAKALNEAKIYK